MKKLCVIGNSSVGALKSGYELLKDKYYTASFWSIPGGGGPCIQIENNKILPAKNRQQDVVTDIQLTDRRELDLSSFDAILLSGVGIPAIRKHNLTIHTRYLAAGFIESQISSDRSILSRALFSLVIIESLKQLDAFQNINKVESFFKKRIFIQLPPLPTANIVEQTHFDMHDYGRNLGDFLSWYYAQQTLIIEEHIKDKNISLLRYPNQWIKDGFTPIEYKSVDAWHMNEKFGEFIMGNLMHASFD